MGVIELKSRAYDILVNIQNLQNELLKVNQEIASALSEVKAEEKTE